MGLLRLLLAAAVVAEHSTPICGLTFTGGHLAVRLFFIISGFYMALILTTKYTADHPKRFWFFISNRFLRIYPCYYVVLLLSLAFYAAATFYLHHPADRLVLWQTAWRHGQIWGLFFVSLCQFTVIGMDAVCVLSITLRTAFIFRARTRRRQAWPGCRRRGRILQAPFPLGGSCLFPNRGPSASNCFFTSWFLG